eukprot:800607-Pleurochrysis_carterae.AAC.2
MLFSASGIRMRASTGATSLRASRERKTRMASAYSRIVSGRSISPCRCGRIEPRCRMYSTNSSIVSALYISPPLAVGSTKGVLPENVRNSAHRSSAVERRRLSAASLARAWNDARSASTRRACSAVGLPRSHSSPLFAPKTPVSPSSAALALTLSARAARVFPAACPRIAI